MTPADLRAVISGGESLTVEFKRGSKSALNDRDIVEAAACLSNGLGGLLLLGVEDNGTVAGAEPRHGAATDPARLVALILNWTVPALSVEVEVVSLAYHEVVVIDVPSGGNPTGTKDGVYKRRSLRLDGKPECIPYAPHEMFSDHFAMQGRDYAEILARGSTWSDLDPGEFDRFRRLVRLQGGDALLAELSDQEVGRSLGVVRSDLTGSITEITLGAILLFGTEQALRRFIPNQECCFQVLDGEEVLTSDVLRVPLFRAAEALFEKLRLRNTEEELQWGMIRVAIPLVPEIAAREAIANALVHRDYAELGMTVVQLTNSSFTVTSPGGFLSGVTLDNLLEVSKPRSRTLAGAFKRAGLVERTGRGVTRMYTAMLRAGRDGPDYTRSTSAFVSVSMPTSRADLQMVRFVVAREQETGRPLPLLALRLLHEVRRLGAARAPALTVVLHERDSLIRTELAALVEQGLIERRGSGKGLRYHLSSAFFRATDAGSSYVRVRGTDAIQQEHMVVEYLRAFSTITRAKAAELCMVTPVQASALLQRLAASGVLVMHGTRRTAYYTLAESE